MPNLAKSYSVRQVREGGINITGTGASAGWKDAEELNDFVYPWEDEIPSRTTFRSVHTREWIYFLFDVNDLNPHVETAGNDKLEVIDSARVEIFFRKDAQLTPYYCLEMDAAARVLDYRARYHRQFEFDWSWPENSLAVRSIVKSDGYTVEAAVSKKSLQELGLINTYGDRTWMEAGLFRAACTHTVNPRDHMRWISWIRPEARTPDFHVPSAFGELRLT